MISLTYLIGNKLINTIKIEIIIIIYPMIRNLIPFQKNGFLVTLSDIGSEF